LVEPQKTPRELAADLISPLVPDWRPTRDQVLWTIRASIVFGAVLGILILIGGPLGISFYQWLQLLIIPSVIAGGGIWFNRQQRERELQIADQRARDDALQAYLDQMSDLLISNNDRPSLYDEHRPESLKVVARARTLTVLPRLDGNRKARVVQFLYESALILHERPILDLVKADLRGGNLSRADLSSALLVTADLSHAYLSSADLSNAVLAGADLSGADLSDADFSGAFLSGVDLSDYKVPDRLKPDLSGVNLSGRDLTTAFRNGLGGAFLSGVNLSGANLLGARLTGANLSSANLSGVDGVTNEELEQQAASLKGATMPNSQRYEEWLKSKDRKEDE
jgi:uncharacterized protein YjbI with pentapeptide repeats